MLNRPVLRMWTGALALSLFVALGAGAQEPLALGSRLEPFVDTHLLESMDGVELDLKKPTDREVAIVFDAPWEGNTSTYVTVMRDGHLYRMYYRASNFDLETKQSSENGVCYAESVDGIYWSKPELGLFEFEGSKENNIIWQGVGRHNFTPFKDTNPDCPPDARYKAIARHEDIRGLVVFKSPDGIHWSLIREEPVITKGAFDSQNLAFYDTVRGRYVDFHRGFNNGVRDIMTCTSQDFINWTEPHYIDYGDAPPEHLYTNAIEPYVRAPHIFIGFPKRFVPSRDPGVHVHPGVSDGVFMTSRDGEHWHRWREAVVRPGLQDSRWVNRNNMPAWGAVRTPNTIQGLPDEISIYTTEGYYAVPCALRRHTYRLDGFVSVQAPGTGGSFTTKPITFAGEDKRGDTELLLNVSTSAAGYVRCEIQDAEGNPIPGYTLEECDELFGDAIELPVSWQGNTELKPLEGNPVRLRFEMADADLYALRFK